MKKLILILSICIGFFAACKKDSTTPTPSPVGFWKGTYSTSVGGPLTNTVYYLFRSNGTMREFYGTDTTTTNKTDGTYTVTDSTVNWHSDYGSGNTFSYTAKIRNNSSKLVGTWGSASSNNNGGSLDVSKQ